jgi:DNA-binding MarR family transcriptional regulator
MNEKKYLKILKLLHFFLKRGKNPDLKSIFFFCSNITHLKLWYLLLEFHYKKKTITMEELYNKNMNISRPTLFKTINNALDLGYLIKCNDIKDKRKWNISLTQSTVSQFEQVINILKRLS